LELVDLNPRMWLSEHARRVVLDDGICNKKYLKMKGDEFFKLFMSIYNDRESLFVIFITL